jgi:transposase
MNPGFAQIPCMARRGACAARRRWCSGGQRQTISAASAVNAKDAFWFCTYAVALNAELFVVLLKKMMRYRRTPVHLVLDGLPAHKKACVREYVESTKGKLTLHFLLGYAPDFNPNELVWSHVKRTGVARRPLQKGEKLEEKVGITTIDRHSE